MTLKETELQNRMIAERHREALQNAHSAIGNILDEQDAKETPETPAPGYRLARKDGRNCSNCSHFTDGRCQEYDFNTSKKYTCESHEEAPAEMTQVLVSELTSAKDGKPFVGLIFGHEFTDMYGRKVTFPIKDKEKYLANTLAAIEDSRTEGGELVGLPIDERGHNKGDAAGRIVGAMLGTMTRRGKVYQVLRFLANWTRIGVDLIGNNIVRGFSPTVNPAGQVVLGGSLTNWIASTDENGVALLPPIELSQTAEENDMGMTDEDKAFFKDMLATAVTGIKTEFDEKLMALKPQLDAGAELSAALLSNDPQAKQIALEQARRQQEAVNLEAQRIVQMELAEQRRKNDIFNLSTRLVNGSNEVPHGLPVTQAELQARLEKLPKEELPFWDGLLTTIQTHGRTDYRELGHNGKMKGLRQLPADLIADLQSGELKVTDLSNPILNLGDLSEYDLNAFKGDK